MKILGIESSCDETAVAIVTDKKEILVNNIYSQIKEHEPYGGVVPEIAARSHTEILDNLIKKSLFAAHIPSFKHIDAIAVTAGPGLIGGVIVGLMTAKSIASVHKLPLIAVNHLEGHALTVRLTDEVKFPYLLLLVSGGHCQILVVEGVGKYRKLGGTIDDSPGEAFDKIAKILKLRYPGGPIVEKYAKEGNSRRFDFPVPLKGRKDCNFSFSGLKTAVAREIELLGAYIDKQDINDLCASFQYAVSECLVDRLKNAMTIYEKTYPKAKTLVVAGGVAANKYLRYNIRNLCNSRGFNLNTPPLKLCTDNGAMIAWAGVERFKLGLVDGLDVVPKARWSLEELS